MKSKRYISAVSKVLCALALAVALPAFADFPGSSTLHIGAGVGSSCPIGGCFVYGTEVNNLAAGDTVSIYQTTNGQDVDASHSKPLLLILAIPNQTTNYFASNPISNVTFYPDANNTGTSVAGSSFIPSAGIYGLTGPGPVLQSFFGSMTSASSDIYSFLGLAQNANNSNSFVNLSGAEAAVNGIVATSFGIHVFAIENNASSSANRILAGQGLANITFNSGALPVGTFAMAYGFKGDFNAGSGKVYSTPFTHAGLTGGGGHNAPEPHALSLFVLALTGATFQRRRRGKAAVAA